MLTRVASLGLVFLLCAPVLQAQEVITFSTAPTHSREETIRLYTPLVNYLSRVTGKRVELDAAANFVEYSTRMRQNRYDIMFDGAHLSGWRIDTKSHHALARLPGESRFVVIGPEDSTITSMGELDRGTTRICAFASPNMLTLAFLSYFPNPARQPNLLRVQGFADLEDCLRSGRGDVAVVHDAQWNRMSQAGLKLIDTQPVAFPDRTFTISTRLDARLRETIRQAMFSEEGREALAPILETFNREQLIPAHNKDYEGLGALLAPVWGFQ